jgi:hypothetical protein
MWSLEHSDAVLDLHTAAEQLLALTGDAATLCPWYGVDTSRAGLMATHVHTTVDRCPTTALGSAGARSCWLAPTTSLKRSSLSPPGWWRVR